MALRFGLVGCGEIGQLRAEAVVRAGHRLIVTADVDATKAKTMAERYSATALLDWRAMLDRSEVDAVIVSTPPSLHAEMCIQALRAGKHVLCEKPLARTPEECRRMLEAARESGRFLATGFNYRFYPSVLKAREILDSGIIGEVDHIRSYTGYSATAHNHDWLHDAGVMGGGSLRDNGIHLLDLTCYFLGDVAQVSGHGTGAVWQFPGCEDNGFALLRSSSGKMATVQASWTEWRGYRFLVEIYGTRGCIRASCFPMFTQVVWSAERGGACKRKNYFFPKTHLMEHLRSYRWVVVQSFVHEFNAFEQAVSGKKSEVATGHDGLLTVEIADKACHGGENPRSWDSIQKWTTDLAHVR